MNRFALIGFYRSLIRHKLYAALNIGGLAVGIAVFLVLGLYVRFESGYEHWLPGYQRIYMVESRTSDDLQDLNSRQSTPVAAWSAISRDLPNTVGTRIDPRNATVSRDGVGLREQMALVDPSFFSVFQMPVVAGDVRDVLASPANVVLTQRTASKYFGDRSAISQTMTITYDGAEHSYRVAAVIADLPADTDLTFDIVARKTLTHDPANDQYNNDHSWNYTGPHTFVRFADGDAARRFEGQLTGIVNRHAASETPDQQGFTIALSLRPFSEVHFQKAGSKLTVATLGIVGLLTLLIAIVNYVNLATARGWPSCP